MSIGWNFPLNNHGQINGISDAGIETFKGKQIASLAREICQNSLDAIKNSEKPVVVEFSKFDIRTKDIPGVDKFKESISLCHDYWEIRNNEKTINFSKKCNEILSSDCVSVLRVSDFNTLGLQGSESSDTTPWQTLVKSSGVSDKNGDAGGSFGIGKSAPFACSYLRTIFYSTLDNDGIKATQGVSKLPTFKLESGETTQGTGYYGNTNKNTHINELIEFESGFIRNETGTDIYILGFVENENWTDNIIKSILSDFLLAVYDKKLVVKVHDIEVSSASLDKIIQKYIDDKEMKNTYNYYKVLTSENTKVYKQDFNGLGEIELLTLFENELHRRVMTSRNSGMKIKELSGISSTIQFASILKLNGVELNRFFREMENPAHDDWQSDRHSNKKLATEYLKDLKRTVKNKIQELARENPTDEMDAEGVGEFLPYDVKDINIINSKNTKEVITDKVSKIEIKKVEGKKVKTSSPYKEEKAGEKISSELGEELDGFLNQTINNGKGLTVGGVQGATTVANENSSDKHFQKVDVMSSRLMYDFKSGEYKYIFVTNRSVENGIVRINLSGEQSSFSANILKVSDDMGNTLISNGNKILLGDLEANEKYKISFKIKFYKNCSLEVGIYGTKK